MDSKTNYRMLDYKGRTQTTSRVSKVRVSSVQGIYKKKKRKRKGLEQLDRGAGRVELYPEQEDTNLVVHGIRQYRVRGGRNPSHFSLVTQASRL